jgi:hypothetical protein
MMILGASIFFLCRSFSTNSSQVRALSCIFVFSSDAFSSSVQRMTILVYDHPMNISAKFDSNLFCGFRKKDENVKFP